MFSSRGAEARNSTSRHGKPLSVLLWPRKVTPMPNFENVLNLEGAAVLIIGALKIGL